MWVSHPIESTKPKNFVIASRLVRRGNLVETKLKLFLRPCHNYSLLIIYYSLKKRSPFGERFSFLSAKLRRNFCFFLLCEENSETNADAYDCN